MAEQKYDFNKLSREELALLDYELERNPDDRDPAYTNLLLPYSRFKEEQRENKEREEIDLSIEEEGKVPLSAYGFQLAQGTLLQGADELANLLVDPTESDLTKRIQEETDLLKRQKPKTALALELAGGLLSGVGAVGTLGRLGVTKFAPLLFGQGATNRAGRVLRPAIPGGIVGGAYNTLAQPEGEKDIYDTLIGTGIGAGGGIAGPQIVNVGQKGIQLGVRTAGRLAGKEDKAIRDVLNPIIDDIGGADVAAENIASGQPLIIQAGSQGEQLGKVADDITPFVIGNQSAKDIIVKTLGNPRDDMTKTFDKIIDEFEGEVKFDDINPNDFKTYTAFADKISDRVFSFANKSYTKAQIQQDVSPEIYKQVSDLLNDFRIKNMGKKIVSGLENVSDRNTLQPVLRKTDDGGFEIIPDNLTVAEAEAIRRQFKQFIKDVDDDTLKVIKSKEASLRKTLDDNYEGLATARRQYAGASEQKRAYESAKQLFTTNRYDDFVDSLDSAITNAVDSTQGEILNAYRRGALVQINKRYDEVADKVSYIRKLNDKGSAEYKLLKEIYPNKSIKELTDEIEKLNNRFVAKTKFATGSQTAERLLKAKDSGLVERATKYVPVVGELAKSILGGNKLSSAQSQRLAELVTEANPQIIDRIRDPKYQQFFTGQIQQFIPSVVGSVAAQNTTAPTMELFK